MINNSIYSLVVATTEADWVPLELCFGIPLFSSELNQKVCRKDCYSWPLQKREVRVYIRRLFI